MKKKLLNILKNLIIILTLVFIFSSISATSVFANPPGGSVGLDVLMRQKVSGWYMILRAVAFASMLILLIVLGMKLLVFSNSSEDKALFKKTIPDWIIGLILLFFIHYIMFYMINLNESFVNKANNWGKELSGLNTAEYDEEITMYESTMSKAYELKFSSGMIGMIMYIMLVVYTYKFVLVYAKRYINVIVLILIAPILCVVNSFKKVISGGNAGLLKKWFKEFSYNVFIQSIHAIFYASLIGLTIKLSEDTLTYVGSILTLLIFGFIFKLDSMIRKIFNFVGGKNTIKEVDLIGTVKSAKTMVTDFQNGQGELYNRFESAKNMFENPDTAQIMAQVGNNAIKFKDKAVSGAKNAVRTLDGQNISVTTKEVEKEREKMRNPNILQKIYEGVQYATYGVIGTGFAMADKIASKTKKKFSDVAGIVKRDITQLNQNAEMVKRLAKIIKAHNKTRNRAENKHSAKNVINDIKQTVINLKMSSKELLDEFKNMISSEKEDILASVYELEGPQAFIYSEVGSPYMGISILASENYESRYSHIFMEQITKRTLSSPRISDSQDIVTEDGIEVVVPKRKKKRYVFKRFNYGSVRTIVHGMNRRVILNNNYLRRINTISRPIQLGQISVRGDVGFKKTSIKYTAKMKSATQIKNNASIVLEKFEQLVQDGRWAQLVSKATDIKTTTHNRINAELLKIAEKPAAAVVIDKLVDMGKAEKIDENTAIIFSKVTSQNTNVSLERLIEQSILGVNDSSETLEINQSIENLDETIQVSKNSENTEKAPNAERIGNVENTEVATLNMFNLKSEKTLEMITDAVLVDLAIDSNVYRLEDLDISNDEENRFKVIDSLIEKGVISSEVKTNEEVKIEILDAMENRRQTMLEENPDAIFETLVQRELADMVKSDIGKENATIDTDTISNINIDDRMYTLSEAIMKASLEKVKSEVQEDAQKIEQIIKEEVEKAKKVYAMPEKYKKKRSFRSSKSEDDEREDSRKDTYTVMIYGAVYSNGKFEVKMGTRVREAVLKAGEIPGVTDWERLDIWLNTNYNINIDTPIDNDMLTIIVPGKDESDDEDFTEEIFERCRPVVEKEIKDYIIEHNISEPETLRKLVHRNMLISQLQKALRNENISRQQIETLVEERIRQVKAIRDAFKDVQRKATIVKNNETNTRVKEEKISHVREIDKVAVENTEEDIAEQMVRQAIVNLELQNLIKNINKNGEKILAKNSEQQEQRARYMDEDAYIMMANMTGIRKPGMA